MRIRYRDEAGRESERVIWPVILGYVETVRVLAAWCELRAGFRHFRTDRILEAQPLETAYPARPAELRARWRAYREANSSATESSSPGGSSRSGPS